MIESLVDVDTSKDPIHSDSILILSLIKEEYTIM